MKTKQLKAMEIIEFWRLIEFLNQKAFPIQNTEDRKVQLSKNGRDKSKQTNYF